MANSNPSSSSSKRIAVYRSEICEAALHNEILLRWVTTAVIISSVSVLLLLIFSSLCSTYVNDDDGDDTGWPHHWMSSIITIILMSTIFSWLNRYLLQGMLSNMIVIIHSRR